MRTSAVSGIIFANLNDDNLKELTAERSMASVPFGARYRIIDFVLSSLANAGITNVGIITKENYRSLMDHIGSGKYWDLDRKNGGLDIIPPYFESGFRKYGGTVDALFGAKEYIERKKSDYVVICPSDTVASVDIGEAIHQHITSGADATVVYHRGKLSDKKNDAMMLSFTDGNRIDKISFGVKTDAEMPYSLGITVISRKLLISLITEAEEKELKSFNRDVLGKKTAQLNIMGYEHTGFAMVMSDTETYYTANMALLESEKRSELFDKNRPVYTKNRDDMPTRYGIGCDVKNSIIADGCVISGKVKNSIIFRGVTVGENSVVENCILMQETAVGDGVLLDGVITDKDSKIGDGAVLKSAVGSHIYIKKNQVL